MRALHLLFALALISLSAAASAQVFCVSTSPQLINALSAAQGGTASMIRLRIGTYLLSASANAPALTIADTSDLSISGGWNTGCTAQIATSPDQTILDAQGTGALLNIDYPDGSSHEVDFSMLSFRGGVGPLQLTAGCVYAISDAGADATLRFDLVSFRGCNNGPNGGGAAALRTDLDGVRFILRNSVIAGNSINNGNAVFLLGRSDGTYTLTNNTIADNLGDDTRGLRVEIEPPFAGEAGDFFRLTNNIVYRNGTWVTADLIFGNNVQALMNNNHIGVPGLIPVGVTVNAATTGDPGFDGNTLQLRPNSPARNSGLTTAPGGLTSVDYALNPRVVGSVVDRGAYEFDGLFANGFE
jgi:hypothetical protein